MAKHATLQMGAATIAKLRTTYRDRWGRDWPEDDRYLTELWTEARDKVPNGRNKVPPGPVWDLALDLMRECHPA